MTDHVENVCKLGQNADCCKYLTMGSGSFECAKITSLKSIIDARTDMNAKSDNCEGKPIKELNNRES